jgi:hypothetical protein
MLQPCHSAAGSMAEIEEGDTAEGPTSAEAPSSADKSAENTAEDVSTSRVESPTGEDRPGDAGAAEPAADTDVAAAALEEEQEAAGVEAEEAEEAPVEGGGLDGEGCLKVRWWYVIMHFTTVDMHGHQICPHERYVSFVSKYISI